MNKIQEGNTIQAGDLTVKIEAKIHRGRRDIFTCKNTKTNEPLILKMKHSRYAFGDRQLEEGDEWNRAYLIMKEIQEKLATLGMPRIVHNDYEWWLEERIIGENIDNASATLRGIEIPYIIEILLSTARQIQALHDEGTSQKDIKTANLVILPTKKAGNITALIDYEGMGIKHPHFGTKFYLAPEQFKMKWDPASDIHALGMVGIELLKEPRYAIELKDWGESHLLTGTKVDNMGNYWHKSHEDIMSSIPRIIGERDPWNLHAGKRLVECISRCISLKPSDRPQCYKDIEDILVQK